jgi:hypothetical protein
MDDHSAEYLQQIAGKPNVMPSVFRIPRVNASMRFAIERTTETSIGLVFFKEQTSAESRNEQSVDFEIVAAPLAPGTVATPIVASFVLSPGDRAALFNSIGAYRLPGDTTGQATDIALGRPSLLANPRRVLIVNLAAGAHLLAYADDAAPGNVGVWYTQGQQTDFLISALRRFGNADHANIDVVQAAVRQLGLTQEQFLARIG